MIIKGDFIAHTKVEVSLERILKESGMGFEDSLLEILKHYYKSDLFEEIKAFLDEKEKKDEQ